MAIKKEDTRFLIQLSKEDKEKLQKLAEQDNRSLTNYIRNLLEIHLENIENNKTNWQDGKQKIII